jgi:Flp pilus assembly protein TadD
MGHADDVRAPPASSLSRRSSGACVRRSIASARRWTLFAYIQRAAGPCESRTVPSRFLRFSVLFFALFQAARATAEPAPIVAVFTVEDGRVGKSHLTSAQLGDLTDYLSARLAEGTLFRIVPPDQLRTALADKKKSSYQSCVDEKCQIEIGKEVAAQKSLATKIIGLGKQCAISSTLYDLRESASELAATYKGGCELDDLGVGLENVVEQLRKHRSSAPPDAANATADAQALLTEGIAAYNAGDGPGALEKLRAAERIVNVDWKVMNDVHWYEGATYRNVLHDNAKALPYFVKCAEISKDLTDWPAYWAVYMQGVYAFEQNDPAHAIEHFARAERYGTAEWTFMNDLYWYFAITYRNQKGDNDRALEYFTKGANVSQDKHDWPAYWHVYMQGVIAYERNQADAALERFFVAEQNGGQDWGFMNDLYWYIGCTYRNLKRDQDKALAYYTKGVEVSKDLHDWPAYWSAYLQGVIAFERNQADAALERFAVAEQNGKAEWAFMNDLYWYMAVTYRNLKGDNVSALEYFQRGADVSQDKRDWPAYWHIYMQGVIAYERSDANAAIAKFALAEKNGAADWGFMNDLYWYWAETHAHLRKDAASAAAYYQKCVNVSQNLSDWPAYWALLNLNDFARAEQFGKQDASLMQELARRRGR